MVNGAFRLPGEIIICFTLCVLHNVTTVWDKGILEYFIK